MPYVKRSISSELNCACFYIHVKDFFFNWLQLLHTNIFVVSETIYPDVAGMAFGCGCGCGCGGAGADACGGGGAFNACSRVISARISGINVPSSRIKG